MIEKKQIIHSGTKFFRYVENSEDPEIIRIYSSPEKQSGSVFYFDKDWNKKRMSLEFLLNNYRMLRMDGMLMISVLKVEQSKDVIVALKNIKTVDNNPYAICRQGIYDVFTNNIAKTEEAMYLGMSISQDTCPANVNFSDLMMCTGLERTKPVAVYIDDTLDDILKLFNNTPFDTALCECEKRTKASIPNKVLLGFCNTLRQLLESNNFMYDFRKCFGIVELPFTMNEEMESLSLDNTIALEQLLKKNIMETYIVKYSKEIDMNAIKRDYVLASSAQNNFSDVFIVGYDAADGEYVNRAPGSITS